MMMNWNGFGRKRSRLKHGIIPALTELRKTMINVSHGSYFSGHNSKGEAHECNSRALLYTNSERILHM
jgi:hypothetical protein